MQVEYQLSSKNGILLSQIADGSEAALKEFYESYHARIYGFALKRLNDPADAADVLNDVMLEVWRSAGRFEGRSKLLTWVLGIAYHKVIDILRRRGRGALSIELDEEMADENSPVAIDILAGLEDAKQVRRCLDQLSDAHRVVMHLAFFEDLSYPEIAEIADCPVGTVKTRMFYAKQALQRCLSHLSDGTVG